MRVRGGGLLISVLAVVVAALSATPGLAGAATVANGGFETGSLNGWQEAHATEAGSWFAYRGTEPPLGAGRGVSTVPSPPQGRFAAITDQRDPDTLTLWQDVTLEPEATHVLSLQAFYQSQLPLAVPTPDTLSSEREVVGEGANEQFRIDVIKPTAPLDTLAPGDILATLFQSATGGPKTMAPTRFSADLSAFAGQTVRIRVVVVNLFSAAQVEEREKAHENLLGVLNAGVDNVVMTSAGPGVRNSAAQQVDGRKLSFGRVKRFRRSGTAILQVKLPVGGLVTASGIHAEGKPNPVVTARKRLAGGTTSNLLIKPTKAGRALLEQKHHLRIGLTVRFRTEEGFESAPTVKHLVLELAPRKKHRR